MEAKKSTEDLRMLPWLAAGGGLLVYLLTLNRWVSLSSLGMVTRLTGWSWQPELTQPLTCLVLAPFRCLPNSWIPLALNGFSAVIAALVLALLARSVLLLPQDIEPAGALPGSARQPSNDSWLDRVPCPWLPPLLAVLVCGLQLTFWEQATAASGEMLDLLVFAWVILCLLEYRVKHEDAWLTRAALAFGAGMANDWVMLGYFPIFVLALFRVKGGGFFNFRFLLRMTLWGLAGLSLYLWLPALHSLPAFGHMKFWLSLKANLRAQKAMLGTLHNPTLRVLGVSSLLALLVLSIRWHSHTVQVSDDTRLGVFLTKATGHFLHTLFFAVAIWLALDPAFGPRRLGPGLPMLTYYYLSALVAGYCAGYLLLFFRRDPGYARARTTPLRQRPALRQAANLAAVLFLALLGGLLLWRGRAQILFTNGPALRDFARQMYQDLPSGKSIGLSDEPVPLYLLQAELSGHRSEKDPLLIDARMLGLPAYRAFLARHFPGQWPTAFPTNFVSPGGDADLEPTGKMRAATSASNRFDLTRTEDQRAGTNQDQAALPKGAVGLMAALAAREPIVYLHSSYGLLFEHFTDEPCGWIHRLAPRPEGGVRSDATVATGEGSVATNEAIWQARWTKGIQMLAEQTKETNSRQPVLAALGLTGQRNATASFLRATYSKSLDYWGTQMARAGHWKEASLWFERAVELNPSNLCAQINALYDRQRGHGDVRRLDAATVQRQFQELFDLRSNWADILNANGPVDEPTSLCEAGRVLLASKNTRQGITELARCIELAPDWPEPKLWLALAFIDERQFAAALDLSERAQAPTASLDSDGLCQALFCRTTALQGLRRTNEAGACLAEFVSRYHDQKEVLATAADLFRLNRQYRKELAMLNGLLDRQPNDVKLLTRKGEAELELGRYAPAISDLSLVLAAEPADGDIRFLRANACAGAGQDEAARGDYQALLATSRHSQSALFGLAMLAWRQKDTNAAIDYCEKFLTNAPRESMQYSQAAAFLRQLIGK